MKRLTANASGFRPSTRRLGRPRRLQTEHETVRAEAGAEAGHGRGQYRATTSLILGDGAATRIVPEPR